MAIMIEDGSKPRWLDKSPAAAAVHEHHQQSKLITSPNGSISPANSDLSGGVEVMKHRTKQSSNGNSVKKNKLPTMSSLKVMANSTSKSSNLLKVTSQQDCANANNIFPSLSQYQQSSTDIGLSITAQLPGCGTTDVMMSPYDQLSGVSNNSVQSTVDPNLVNSSHLEFSQVASDYLVERNGNLMKIPICYRESNQLIQSSLQSNAAPFPIQESSPINRTSNITVQNPPIPSNTSSTSTNVTTDISPNSQSLDNLLNTQTNYLTQNLNNVNQTFSDMCGVINNWSQINEKVNDNIGFYDRPQESDNIQVTKECWQLQDKCNSQKQMDILKNAWTLAWSNGIFPNPEDVCLSLDTTVNPSINWQIVLANLWSDVLLRRVVVFAVAAFYPFLIDSKLNPKVDSTFGITYDDVKWMFQNRFNSCVPVILANCFIQAKTSNAAKFNNSFNRPEMKVTSILKSCPGLENVRQLHTPSSSHSSASSSQAQSPQATIFDQNKCNISKYPYSNFTNYLSPGDSNLGIPGDNNSDNQDECIDLSSSEERKSQEEYCTSVCFHVLPSSSLYISLSNLSSALCNLKSKRDEKPYPILQYLDAYICQLASFLGKQPLLLGIYMALKLTDTEWDVEEEIHNQLVELDNTRKSRLQKLHLHLIKLFGIAASETNDKKITEEEARQAADSRRSILPEFLNWGRQFDIAWQHFLQDTYSSICDHENLLNFNTSFCNNSNQLIATGLMGVLNIEPNFSTMSPIIMNNNNHESGNNGETHFLNLVKSVEEELRSSVRYNSTISDIFSSDIAPIIQKVE